MRTIVLVAHNIRSAHNVGSLFRTCDGLGISKLYLGGYTPYPVRRKEQRLPHLAAKAERQIAKTALGAEQTANWSYEPDTITLLTELKKSGYQVAALEQTAKSMPLANFKPTNKLALVVGNEIDGLDPKVIEFCDASVEIPMLGTKESFNVAIAAAMALYQLRFVA